MILEFWVWEAQNEPWGVKNQGQHASIPSGGSKGENPLLHPFQLLEVTLAYIPFLHLQHKIFCPLFLPRDLFLMSDPPTPLS